MLLQDAMATCQVDCCYLGGIEIRKKIDELMADVLLATLCIKKCYIKNNLRK